MITRLPSARIAPAGCWQPARTVH